MIAKSDGSPDSGVPEEDEVETLNLPGEQPPARLWDVSDEVPSEAPVTTTQRLPEDQLRRWSLVGIGMVVVMTILVTVIGTAFDWYSEEFARLLLQLVVPPLLSAFAVVVGYLFAERKRS